MLSIVLLMSVATTIVGLAIPLVTSNLVDSFSIAYISPSQIAAIVGAFIGQAIALGMSTQSLIIAVEIRKSDPELLQFLLDHITRKFT